MKADLTMKSRHITRQKAVSSVEAGLLIGLIAVLLLGVIASIGQNLSVLFGRTQNTLNTAHSATEPDAPGYGSCKEWAESGDPDFNSTGVNDIYPNGATQPIAVACYQGLTLIVAQFEEDPVTDWNEGIQEDYDPTRATKKGFALNSAQIPPHSKVYFGGAGNGVPPYCLHATYSTGDLAAWRAPTGAETDPVPIVYSSCFHEGNAYFMSREKNAYYQQHNPNRRTLKYSDPEWNNTLVLQRRLSSGYLNTATSHLYVFSPNRSNPRARGYSYGSAALESYQNLFPWLVWVE